MNVIVLKKMKKGLILAAAACLTILGAKAQTTAKVNVVLNPALSIEVNDASLDQTINGLEEAKAVNLVYKTASDYVSGVKKPVADHLKVTAVGTGYKIYARASSNTLARSGGNGENAVMQMAGEIVTVKVHTGSAITIADINAKSNQVNTINGKSVKGETMYVSGASNSNASVVAQPINVEYAARALNSAEVKGFLGTNNTQGARYTVNVIYDILAD